MGEILKIGRNRYFAAGLALSTALMAAACGPRTTGTTDKLRNCVNHNSNSEDANVFYKGSDVPVTSTTELLGKAARNISLLRQRALIAGGSINLHEHWNTEIVDASTDSITFAWPTVDLFHDTNNIKVNFKDGQPQLSANTLVCFDSGSHKLYPNGAYTDIQQYVADTDSFSAYSN